MMDKFLNAEYKYDPEICSELAKSTYINTRILLIDVETDTDKKTGRHSTFRSPLLLFEVAREACIVQYANEKV
jgi:hypothetical protein